MRYSDWHFKNKRRVLPASSFSGGAKKFLLQYDRKKTIPMSIAAMSIAARRARGKGGKGGGRGGEGGEGDEVDVVAKAFTLSMAGSTADLASMLRSGAVDASSIRPDGMYRTWSLLHAAAFKGHTACVRMLLSEGAEKAPINAQGKTPAQLAEAKGFSALAALIEGCAQDELGRDIGLPANVAAVAAAGTDEGALAMLLDRTANLRLLSESQAPTPRDELEAAAATPVSLARTLSEQRVDAKAMAVLRDAERAAVGAPVPVLPRRAASSLTPQQASISPPALAPRRMRSESVNPSWRTFPGSSVAHRSTLVCEQVPWRIAEEVLRASPPGAVLHLSSLLHYPSSAPLMPLVLSERIDDQSVDRLQTLGLLPHMARLCAVARHPVDPKSALFFGRRNLAPLRTQTLPGHGSHATPGTRSSRCSTESQWACAPCMGRERRTAR